MAKKWQRFWLFHVALLGAAAFFYGYGRLVLHLFPDQNFYHCFIHDVLRLYCPFCGFTRASQALAHLDIATALRLNPAVVLALVAYTVLDVRAFVLLCRGHEGRLTPRFLLPGSLLWFGSYTVLLNGLLLFGIDPVGDQLGFWTGLALWRSICGTLLLAAAMYTFLYLLNRLYHRRYCRSWLLLILLGVTGVATLFILYLEG
ncbi:MAG: DUF2752 domain-containing protein [Clostridia bacterium]|nr:DUF2752 domain-containing protein [Clostridia bacterium]